MKLADAYTANLLANARDELVSMRDRWALEASLSNGFKTIRLEAPVIEQLKPIVAASIDARIAEVDRNLRAIGVDLA